MSLNKIKTVNKKSGFTIVELLIVIVVIGILAAITIVAYNGVQNRARTSSAQAAANTLTKKAEAYQTVKAAYPKTKAEFETVEESKLAGSVTLSGAALAATTPPAQPQVIEYSVCGTGEVGFKVVYYDYANKARSTALTGGDVSGTCTLVTT